MRLVAAETLKLNLEPKPGFNPSALVREAEYIGARERYMGRVQCFYSEPSLPPHMC